MTDPQTLDDRIVEVMLMHVSTNSPRVEARREGAQKLLAALRRAGLEVVPVEPTEAMLCSIDTPNDRLPITGEETYHIWQAMVKAACT